MENNKLKKLLFWKEIDLEVVKNFSIWRRKRNILKDFKAQKF
jgi:hypothetical protein